ncbi:DGQHR domain-containing protein [Chryseobacterium sp. MEBOG07]|uniref:DGQHR domain-containing protein n=1 Tax=Chryseobacterium sp. MEBOG07 TaxID=2879939 RepID=UPI001F26D030|nr:DGQHR domain-containing protein [Chryseobacterium sp. MEBOG07]UKB81291.1 DGQHR domain-containing protein [Chryseobacterium sp. MEBOG07]
MNNIIIRVSKYSQNNQEYISGVFPFSIISNTSKVLVYEIDDDGYQRKPNRSHYLKIKNYILKNKNDFKFPTSLILGCDKSEITKLLKYDDCGNYLEFDENFQKKIFRIVDGQHRIEGINEALKDDNSLLDLLFNVVILVSPENKKSVELEAFIDINSTAKRISTDLATLARFDYEIKENSVIENNAPRHIAIKTAYHLKEDFPKSVWNSAIKFDIHSDISLGIVGVTLFRESIDPIISILLESKLKNKSKASNSQIIRDYDFLAKDIANELDKVWNEIIRKKWSECFSESIVKNEAGELKHIYYSNDYYIQKTLGVKVLNGIYSEVLKQYRDNTEAFDAFRKIIMDSKIMSKDWKKGGLFSGLSSESGFYKIRKMIKNEIEKPIY